MSIVTNGTTIPESAGNVIYDGIEVTEVICNGVEVWKSGITFDATMTCGANIADRGYVLEVPPFIAGYGDLAPNMIGAIVIARIECAIVTSEYVLTIGMDVATGILPEEAVNFTMVFNGVTIDCGRSATGAWVNNIPAQAELMYNAMVLNLVAPVSLKSHTRYTNQLMTEKYTYLDLNFVGVTANTGKLSPPTTWSNGSPIALNQLFVERNTATDVYRIWVDTAFGFFDHSALLVHIGGMSITVPAKNSDNAELIGGDAILLYDYLYALADGTVIEIVTELIPNA